MKVLKIDIHFQFLILKLCVFYSILKILSSKQQLHCPLTTLASQSTNNDVLRETRVTLKKSEVIAVVKELDIPIIDIHQEVFSVHPDPLSLFPFRTKGHYTADGYREVAKAIIEKIKN